MPRFMRSIWTKPAANAPEGESAIPTEMPEMNERLERLKEADFVRDFQKKLMVDSANVANSDSDPRVTNIFDPVDDTDID